MLLLLLLMPLLLCRCQQQERRLLVPHHRHSVPGGSPWTSDLQRQHLHLLGPVCKASSVQCQVGRERFMYLACFTRSGRVQMKLASVDWRVYEQGRQSCTCVLHIKKSRGCVGLDTHHCCC
jgi:hypothetical protein